MLFSLFFAACTQEKCNKGSFKVDENGMRFGFCNGRDWRSYDLIFDKDSLRIRSTEAPFSKGQGVNVAILTHEGRFIYSGCMQYPHALVEVDSRTTQINGTDYMILLRLYDNYNLDVIDSITMIVSKEEGLRYYSESGDACYRAFL
jgi:hypothetical protein